MSDLDWPAGRHISTAALIARIQGLALVVASLILVGVAVFDDLGVLVPASVMAGLALLHYGAGWHLARFSREARTVLTLVALPTVLLFPLGTAWFAYLVRAAWGGRGRRWFEAGQPHEPVPPFRSLVTLAVAATLMAICAWMLTTGVAIPTVAELTADAENSVSPDEN